jgi:hypothetical protein
MKSKSSVVAAFTPEAVLKRKIRAHLRKLGFDKSSDGSLCPPSSSKDTIRALHSDQRKAGLKAHRAFIKDAFPRLKKYLAEGKDIDPAKITPELELISAGTWQSELFRLASLSWSVPVSNGFGRRLRYLVWDKANGKLMGIIAIGDPVFNLKARDDLFAWTIKDRGKRLVNMLDAYVLGAVPPYNMILTGKLVSCLVRSREIRDDFRERYGDIGGQPLLVREVDLISPDVLGGQRIRRHTEVTCKQRYLLEIRCLCMRRQIPHLHVLSHPLSKNRHGKLLCDMKALQAAPPASRNRTSSGMQEVEMLAPKLATSRLPRSGDAPESDGLPCISEEAG